MGRLVLYLCGYSDAERQRLSDATCTALQLANFWQDVTVDWEKDRVYIPLEVLERHGSSVEDIAARRATPGFVAAMREVVDRARALFLEGLPLAGMVDRRLALDIELFSRGGMRVLDKIAAQDYDVLSRRPAISKTERVWILLGALARRSSGTGGVNARARPVVRILPRVSRARAPKTSTTRSSCCRASSATPCAPSMPSCAIATT